MAGKDILMVSQEERKRLHLIHKVIEGAIKQVLAAEVIHLSYRHTNRIVNKVRREGDKAIVHKSRGKPSNRRLPEKVKNKIVKLYRDKYKGFGATLFSEKIFEGHKIKIAAFEHIP